MDAVVELRVLNGTRSELAALQHVLDSVPRYARAITGAPFGPDEARQTFTGLPHGKTMTDKFVLGVYRDNEMIGCVDLVRGYPVATTAMLGLLVVVEELQGSGFGSRACRLAEEIVRAWGVCDRIRIGVVANNGPAFPFWSEMGFIPTGEVTPYTHGSLSSEIVVLEKPLEAARADA